MKLTLMVKLYEVTKDPLLLDGIRAVTTKTTPPEILESIGNYVESLRVSYLNLYQNSDTPIPYEFRTDPNSSETAE